MKIKSRNARKIIVKDYTQHLNTKISKHEFFYLVENLVNAVLKHLKRFGFKEKEMILFRIQNDIVQKIIFEADYYRGAIRVDLAIEPVFGLKSDFLYNDRQKELREFDEDNFNWYLLSKEEYPALVRYLCDLIEKKVQPFFDSLNSPEKILNNLKKLEKNNRKFDYLIMMSALWEGKKEVAVYQIENKLMEMEEDKNLAFVKKHYFYLNKMNGFLKEGDLKKIKENLLENKRKYFEFNYFKMHKIRNSKSSLILFVLIMIIIFVLILSVRWLFF